MNAHTLYSSVQQGDRDDLVSRHAGLVKRIAHHLAARLPESVRLEDLIQAGMIGLLESARNYDAGQGARFETYASIRIRGSMLDEIRRNDWTPRSVHRRSREVSEAMRAVEARTGRDARDQEVADEMGIPLEEYHVILRDAATSQVFSIDHDGENGNESRDIAAVDEERPEEVVENSGFRDALKQCIDGLPERERLVMSLYYVDELNQREIGEVLGVTESRVCQIHSKALARVRSRMTDWL